MNNVKALPIKDIPDPIQCVKTGATEKLEMSLRLYQNSINKQDDMGLTALHWAAHLRNYEAVVAILGTSKADFLIRDHNNKSVMDHALAGNHAQIINLILQYQENNNNDTPQ